MKEESRDNLLGTPFYTRERKSFTLADLVNYHVGITKKFAVRQEEVELEEVYGEKGYRKGLYDFPNSVVSWGLTEIDPGMKAPLHRQLHEATLFILQGKGYSLINGEPFEWEEGDVVFVPMHSWHTQVNDSKERVRYVTAGTIPFFRYLGIYRKENHREPSPDEMALLKKEMPGKIVIKKKDWLAQAGKGQTQRGKDGKVWRDTRFDFPYKIGKEEIPSIIPARSENHYVHTHFNEALVYIMNGHGFSLVHDRKVEWEKGCVVRIPTYAWHHHYNLSDEPVVLLRNITTGLNNHLKWRVQDNLPPEDIRETPLGKLL